MKYRRLTKEELEPLNEEFLKYLLVQGIDPNAWQELKNSNLAQAEKHLDIFSDLVFEKILMGISFIDIIQEKRVEVYQFTSTKAYAFIVELKPNVSFDFTAEQMEEISLNNCNIWQAEKDYVKSKEEEMFEILARPHAAISSGKLFKELALLVK